MERRRTGVAAAKARADEATTAAKHAHDAANGASEQTRKAYQEAAAAATAAAEAATSAAQAKQYAAQAARDGAAARAASASARKADAQARADGIGARKAANEAANNAAIAGKKADEAKRDADRANDAAAAADRDAAAARTAADHAEADAAAAHRLAERARKSADSANTAANNALQYAIDSQAAADRAEDAEREYQTRVALVKGTTILPTGVERSGILKDLEDEGEGEGDEYKRLEAIANRSLRQYLEENLADILKDAIGWTDAEKCFLERNWWACLEVASILIPGVGGINRSRKTAKQLIEHGSKIKKYLAEANAARKKLDALRARPKRKKDKDDDEPCQGSWTGLRWLAGQAAVRSWWSMRASAGVR